MEWLNYHHLLYFWTVAKEGSIVGASDKLSLTQATISAQIRSFEENLGEKLFTRVGRRLILTETGRLAFRYADEIFSLGREFMDTLKGRPSGQPLRFRVGITDILPKLIAQRLLEPAFQIAEPVRMICHEGKTDSLLAQLALHELDLVLTDVAMPGGMGPQLAAEVRRLGARGSARDLPSPWRSVLHLRQRMLGQRRPCRAPVGSRRPHRARSSVRGRAWRM